MADDAVRVLAVHGQLTGRRSTLRIERLVLPDGTETVRDTLYHPDSVAILPLDDDGNVVMVRQYRNAAGRELLELQQGSSKAMNRPSTPLAASCGKRPA